MRYKKLADFLISVPATILLIVFIIIAVHQNTQIQNKEANTFKYSDTTFYIQGTGSSDKIQYKDMNDIDLVNKVDTRAPIDDEYFDGEARTIEYGDAKAYVYPHVKSYIIIKTDRQNYIVNDANVDKTKTIYETLQKKM